MIKEVFIFHKSGISIFHKLLSGETEISTDFNNVIFASVSSAISSLLRELGHDNLQVIEVGSGKLFYSISNDLFFVVHATNPEGEIIGPYLLKQLETDFTCTYSNHIKKKEWKIVETANFIGFNNKIQNIHDELVSLQKSTPRIFKYFPTNLSLSRFKELQKISKDLIKGFPMNTIRLLRRIDREYGEEFNQDVYHSLGYYTGHEINKKKHKNKIGVNPSDVLKLLREISVAKYDAKKERFTLLICPICRGKTADITSCHFFAGFIQGCFDNPDLSAIETECKAKGDKNCVFQIIR